MFQTVSFLSRVALAHAGAAVFLSVVPLVKAQEPGPVRALLIVGGCCHDYAAQKEILSTGLSERAHLKIDVIHQGGSATDSKIPLYERNDWAAGYDVVIHDECFADVKDAAWLERVLKPHRAGLPAVVLHCAMHSYRAGSDDWFEFTGVTSRGHGAHYPHEVLNREATHPIMKDFGPAWWNPAGELYHVEKFWPTAHALASSKNQETGAEEICVWINDYKGARVFGTTLGHHNETVSHSSYLDLVARGTLWAAGRLEKNYLKPAPKKLSPVNLAQGKKASASTSQEGHPPEHAVDGSTSTRWCANGAQTNEWCQIDLGASEMLTRTELNWEANDAIYRYRIEGSVDGSLWQTLVDGSTNTRAGVCRDSFPPRALRHVRVTFLGANTGHWGSLYEVQVFGDKLVSTDARELARDKENSLMAEVKVPAEFSARIFASPPAVNYPVFVAAAPDGTLFVSSDGNGSLGRDPSRGRVIRLRDLDGDGRADESKMFVANIDSPRGLVWDHDRLYLLHPPHLSEFIDRDADGIADQTNVLVKNIAFGFKDRPADHTSNGIELGVDGWIYCAIGDFGFMEATGTDGRKLQLRGGGAVRVRPDGTGLELFARGTRNILEVAVSPLLDLFARDNTNDGDGWDVRLHHLTALAEHGYPSLYKNFADEIIKPLSDYGGGSGCGAAWIDEPGFPEEWNNTFYTADWGRQPIFRHSVTPTGSTFAETQAPKEFVAVTRSTDLDVDAQSRAYVASWRGATFNWAGPDVGYIVQVAPKGFHPKALPDFQKATDPELVALLEDASHRRRLEAQRTLVRRGLTVAAGDSLTALARDSSKPLASRVSSLFALKQGLGAESTRLILPSTDDASIAAWALRALADHEEQIANVPSEPFVAALRSGDGRIRREALVGLARLGRAENAAAMTLLLGDDDAVVAHTAVRALVHLRAGDASFSVIDQSAVSGARRTGALRVLQSLHTDRVVDQLIKRLQQETDSLRARGLFTALSRLHFKEGKWAGDSWGTRPDTSGPYYQAVEWEASPRIAAALKSHFNQSADTAFLIGELTRHRIQSDDILSAVIAQAQKDAALVPALVVQLARAQKVPPITVNLLISAATNETTDEATRALAVAALEKSGDVRALGAMLEALPHFMAQKPSKEVQAAREAFLNSPALQTQHALLLDTANGAKSGSAAWANAALLRLSNRKETPAAIRESSRKNLAAGWDDSKRRAEILHAVALIKHRASSDKVLASLEHSDPAVRNAAERAATALKLERAAQPKPSATLLADMTSEAILAEVGKAIGKAEVGEELFTRQSCANCHTVSADQPLRGPFLGNIATIYPRKELAEAILAPNKTIAQGFVSHHFELKDGTEHDGFVTQESADTVAIRNGAGQEILIAVADIATRDKLERSMMPEGLAGNLTIEEFASLLAYLEKLAQK